jgi:hypothetical protein
MHFNLVVSLFIRYRHHSTEFSVINLHAPWWSLTVRGNGRGLRKYVLPSSHNTGQELWIIVQSTDHVETECVLAQDNIRNKNPFQKYLEC